MPFTVAVLTDVHYGNPGLIPKRRSELGAVLMRRAVERLNRFVRPQLVVVLGDLLDQPEADRAEKDLRELRDILDRLTCPYLAIPGNHDPSPTRFYEILPEPDPVTDLGGVRVLSFTDPEEPGYHARRTEQDLARLRTARQDGFAGPVIALQHVPVMPRGQELRYSYTNLDEVLAAGTEGGVTLSIGGHCHQTSDLVQAGAASYLAVEALCEAPHGYALVTLEDDGSVRVERQTLAMPEAYGLLDLHSHTQLAYCASGVSVEDSPRIAHAMGLRGMALTEHSGHLYFNRSDFYSTAACRIGAAGAPPQDSRVGEYFQLVCASQPPLPVLLGMEIDTEFAGTALVQPADRAELDWAVGAVHFIPAGADSQEQFVSDFQRLTAGICESGVDVLAHPFRIFRRQRREVPTSLYPWLIELLLRTEVAAEINFHTNEPHPAFVRMCLESGVRLTFGSDAHELWEVGEFFGHLRLLEQLGVTGDPSDHLLQPRSFAEVAHG